MLQLRPMPKVITFDCYGTLVQWHDAVRRAAADILGRRGPAFATEDEASAFADRIRAAAVARQDRAPFCDYRTVLMTALEEVLPAGCAPVAQTDRDALLSILSHIPPHPEVPAALARLRERFRIAIISNTADDLIAGTVAMLGVPLDGVVTAEQARAYKPDHRLFHHAYRVLGVTLDETVHVGMGQVTDLKVCQELGIRSVWIDRVGEPLDPAWSPDAILPDLSGLPDLLVAP